MNLGKNISSSFTTNSCGIFSKTSNELSDIVWRRILNNISNQIRNDIKFIIIYK